MENLCAAVCRHTAGRISLDAHHVEYSDAKQQDNYENRRTGGKKILPFFD
jgi:hypothetical protein